MCTCLWIILLNIGGPCIGDTYQEQFTIRRLRSSQTSDRRSLFCRYVLWNGFAVLLFNFSLLATGCAWLTAFARVRCAAKLEKVRQDMAAARQSSLNSAQQQMGAPSTQPWTAPVMKRAIRSYWIMRALPNVWSFFSSFSYLIIGK